MHYRKDIAHRALRSSNPDAPAAEAMSYASAGVSIDAGNRLVNQIKSLVKSTQRPGADAEIGGFGGTFELEAAGYKSPPVILGAIDGVGTKLKIAHAMGKHDTVGIDLVAMNVNDLVVQGAESLFFLDCYSCSTLDVDTAAAFVSGVAEGCKLAGCALIGGETAEMPGMFTGDEYDAVGAAIGAVHKDRILPAFSAMKEGDILLGVASSGVHSNGFSLVRRIVEKNGLTWNSPCPWDKSTSIGLSLLTPTKIYVKSLVSIANKGLIKGMSHITGGGLTENVPRMLPKHLEAEIDVKSWELPGVFKWLKKAGNVAAEEMGRTFNTGFGMVLVVAQEDVEEVVRQAEEMGEKVRIIGKLSKRTGEGCVLKGLESWDI
jgi:phosphoribosylamine--glycine ligase / phosphoribosylformylglycinamidine cyclo-ligase